MRTLPALAALAALGSGSLFGGGGSGSSGGGSGGARLEAGWEWVTAGSTIKLAHAKSAARLTMPQVSYGTGSQQQAITAQPDAALTAALWRVEPERGVERGAPVECGARVRLVNSDSDHSLHSHSGYKSPISGAQEVSGFDGRDGGDIWTVECLQGAELWRREAPVHLRHSDTGRYLQSLPAKKYRQPIAGHQEVSAAPKPDSNAQWVAMEGYYFARPKGAAK
ncbi:hypothetical protein H4R18_002070 [Coemansia javaensis]|uniref:MIR domain-containing protein n=1 Tax=Coemansia javaensis TaxID=2761396 RepID=A0A9W8HD16_9FUNG|nr:hypothetical protein H4R18_002070 [Coemansia javaensis]